MSITWACLLADSRSQRVHSLTYILIRSLIAEAPVPQPSSSSPPRLGPLLIMESTTSLLEPTSTKPITSMTLAELRQTCQFFELPQTGITPTIRNRLQNFLTAHKQRLRLHRTLSQQRPFTEWKPACRRLARLAGLQPME